MFTYPQSYKYCHFTMCSIQLILFRHKQLMLSVCILTAPFIRTERARVFAEARSVHACAAREAFGVEPAHAIILLPGCVYRALPDQEARGRLAVGGVGGRVLFGRASMSEFTASGLKFFTASMKSFL